MILSVETGYVTPITCS